MLLVWKLGLWQNDGKISVAELSTVMRSLGYNPTPDEVRELVNTSAGSGQFTARGGLIDLELFKQLMRNKARDDDMEGELKDAFRVLDKDGQGWITAAQMAQVCRVRSIGCLSTRAARLPLSSRQCAAPWSHVWRDGPGPVRLGACSCVALPGRRCAIACGSRPVA